jgi:hypothetical protein
LTEHLQSPREQAKVVKVFRRVQKNRGHLRRTAKATR